MAKMENLLRTYSTDKDTTTTKFSKAIYYTGYVARDKEEH
jgi:hypothetical protein